MTRAGNDEVRQARLDWLRQRRFTDAIQAALHEQRERYAETSGAPAKAEAARARRRAENMSRLRETVVVTPPQPGSKTAREIRERVVAAAKRQHERHIARVLATPEPRPPRERKLTRRQRARAVAKKRARAKAASNARRREP